MVVPPRRLGNLVLERELRGEQLPAAFPDTEALVAGDTAEAIDEADTMSRWIPIVFAFVLAACRTELRCESTPPTPASYGEGNPAVKNPGK